ncbi:MAG: succinylglutamate desuccinylase/aspartoacylase family protein [Alphaproteobacteria bacterium]|nr:succinylglutamate desuccinylase/aspartoacylase family protein [Alphaproteobacteria bacterium]
MRKGDGDPPPAKAVARDIAPYRRGNTGIDFVHRFDSGRPGPSVAIAGLTHGNEICGMTAVTWLLDRGVRPRAGTLTLWLGNVAAYERMRADLPERHTRHRFVDRDLNRAWADEVIAGDLVSLEAHRVRELLPVVEAQDRLLDIHSTTYCGTPFFVYRDLPRARVLAEQVGGPSAHVLLGGGQYSGLTMAERGRFGDAGAEATCLVVECGRHLDAAAGDTALQVALDFLAACGTLDRDFVAAHRPAPAAAAPTRRFRVEQVFRPVHDDARFARDFVSFETLPAGAPIAFDGDRTLTAPFDECVILMPTPVIAKGRDMVTLARIVD